MDNCFAQYKESDLASKSVSLEPIVNDAQVLIQGIVKDASGYPIPNAHIWSVDKTKGTATDEKGRFSIWISLSERIQVTHLGYKSRSIFPKITSINQIVLEEDLEQLDEVVLTASKKKSYWWLVAIAATVGVVVYKNKNEKKGLNAASKKNVVNVTI